ncbi:Xpo1 [Ecytonucleospora hepatopenaei]|uniref:Xpo1 n=1 Tax=Ecytonucleospora hepatopenaei TaxID=646526 RepID=A0A1W0E6C2_9MICR|nr:Xpo1 [Ecytonucleospora hepatopenaei]
MEKILNLEGDFDIELFDKIVQQALSSNATEKTKAESVLLQFKKLNNSWLKVDFILKNSKYKESKFIALQILEENINTKWNVFDVGVKKDIREYLFLYIVNNCSSNLNDIVLKKFNSALISIIKKDWPKLCPDFISNLINISQTTNMDVCANSLVILREINEEIFFNNSYMSISRVKTLKEALEKDYNNIFTFIVGILEFSEKQELSAQLLKNCLLCLGSFCKSMNSGYIFSTRIIEIILTHLNSSHSIEVLLTLHEIIDLFVVKSPDGDEAFLRIPQNIDSKLIYEKILIVYQELLGFFDLYMSKFDHENELAKLYFEFDQSEKLFVKVFSRCFCSILFNFFDKMPQELNKRCMLHLINVSKIKDIALFREIFVAWQKIIFVFYSEYPFFKETAKPLIRNEYIFVLEKLFPVMIGFMPKPQEVFVVINELGEIVKDKTVQTVDIEFGKKMSESFKQLCYPIKDFILKYLYNECQKLVKTVNTFDLNHFNRVCWVIGCFANVLEKKEENDFFVNTVDVILTICGASEDLNRKSIVASCTIYIISKYCRFLKNNVEFMYLVIQKLFEFMETDLEGLDEMSCDAFLTIAQNAPTQFLSQYKGNSILVSVLGDLGKIKATLRGKQRLQRVVVEGLFEIIKSNKIENGVYVTSILQAFCDYSLIAYDQQKLKNVGDARAICHLFECYSIGFEYVPHILQGVCNKNDVVLYYKNLLDNSQFVSEALAKIVKEAIVNLCIKMATNDNSDDFYNILTEVVLFDYQHTFCAKTILLSSVMINNAQKTMFVQRLLFLINNIVIPSTPLLLEGDNHQDVCLEILKLNANLIKTAELYGTYFTILMTNDKFDQFFEGVLFTMSCINEISSCAIEFLKLLFERSFEANNQQFFVIYFFRTLENLIGLLIDRDTRHNNKVQCEFLYLLMNLSIKISLLDEQKNNKEKITEFLISLFTGAFENLTILSVQLFIKGLFEIKNIHNFTDHVSDFTVKIYEYGSDEYVNEDKTILMERINQLE